MEKKISIEALALDYLDEAESMFGKKIEGWKFQAIEFVDKGPSLMYYPEEGIVTIALSKKALEHPIQIVYQLSHEVCHLLHPSRNFQTGELYVTTKFNEGLSTYFQFHILEKYDNIEHYKNDLKSNYPKYYSAYELVNQLIVIDSSIIRNLRKIEPRIDLIDENHFAKFNNIIPKHLIQELIKPF